MKIEKNKSSSPLTNSKKRTCFFATTPTIQPEVRNFSQEWLFDENGISCSFTIFFPFFALSNNVWDNAKENTPL